MTNKKAIKLSSPRRVILSGPVNHLDNVLEKADSSRDFRNNIKLDYSLNSFDDDHKNQGAEGSTELDP